jgi:hypothetical protein
MLHYCEGLLSDRKKRLYLVGCCRNIWDRMKHKDSRWAVVVAERFADGEAPATEMLQANDAARRVSDPLWQWTYGNSGHRHLERVLKTASAMVGAVNASSAGWALNAGPNITWAAGSEGSQPVLHEKERQAVLIRCILGNPYRPTTLQPVWLTSPVLALSRHIYNSRDFSLMPIFADALEEAGCSDVSILDHCRGPGPHTRGCWVLDLILTKE